MKLPAFLFLSLLLFALVLTNCQNEETTPAINPKPEKIYPDVLLQMDPTQAAELSQKLRQEIAVELADGLELSLWASDSLVKDPVAISIDNQGGIYYTHAERITNSEFDIRGYQDWMTTSQSWESVEDRRAFLRKTYAPEKSAENTSLADLNKDGSHDWKDLTVEKEKIWRLDDTNKDGVADQSRLYIEDFHEEITDLANGVEFFEDEVFIAVGPDLWRTRDTDGDGRANSTTSISHGYAVHIGFGAHGMSGVTIGPDGRVWWGIGDIGMNVVDQTGKRWKYPNQGVIVRCELDGSNFEVFSHGHRNTHEFAFDKYGNLITEDNDGDHPGERERLVYIVQGSDSGWRSSWQYGKYTDPDNNKYNVWMDEKMSVPRWEQQAAYILPPIMNYVNGPTGLVYNPGTALSEKWYDHFFVAEFRGTAARSPIHAFKLKPKGATFELDRTEEVVKGTLPTGLDFGPDGALYFGDWIDGWGAKDYGRVWKLDTKEGAASAIRKEVKALINEGLTTKSIEELNGLLTHQDMRIRQKAQFELVKRGASGTKSLVARINDRSNQLARIHALWGIGQLARKDKLMGAVFAENLKDADPEIIAQCLKLIGDIRYDAAADQLIPFLAHEQARVRFFAAEALGRIKHKAAVAPLLKMLEKNNDEDAWLRHAACYALSEIGEADPLLALADDPSKALRTAAVVSLRRMRHEGIAVFLNDTDEYVVAEAARAINDDLSITGALPALADLLNTTSSDNEVILRRAINANLRLGQTQHLDQLLAYMQKGTASEAMRAEAIAALSTWASPSLTDRVDGRYRGPVTRNITDVQAKFNPLIAALVEDRQPAVAIAAAGAASKLGLESAGKGLISQLSNNSSETVRAAALSALGALKGVDLVKVLGEGLADKSSLVRSKALELLPQSKLPMEKVMPLFRKIIAGGSVKEKQSALATLGTMGGGESATYLSDLFEQFSNGEIEAAIQLDLLDALEAHGEGGLAQKVKAYYDKQEASKEYASFDVALEGGDQERGRRIFYENKAAQCVRCHSIFEYGGDAGPSLTGVGSRMSKAEILESIVNPNAVLAAGYGVVTLEMKDGQTIAGFYMAEDDQHISIREGKEATRKIEKAAIKERMDIPSSMPPILQLVSKKEIRDLVAFLSTIKMED